MFWNIFLQTLALIIGIIVAGLIIERFLRSDEGES